MPETVKERIKALEVSLDEVKTNHLPHLQEAIDKVDARTWVILAVIIIGFLSSIALSLWK